MTTNYTLIAGPSKHDLILGLTEKKLLTFRAKNNAGEVTLFEVMIAGLTLFANEANPSWEIKGLIASKNRKRQTKGSSKCSAIFDTQKRTGYFNEIEPGPVLYSIGYFDRLSDIEIQEEIDRLKKCLPGDQLEFEQYVSKLDPHTRLVLEGVKVWGLIGAYSGTTISHEAHLMLRAEQSTSKGS